MNSSSTSSAPRIMFFRPTLEELGDFSAYIEKIEATGAHNAGLVKIIPPQGWCPRKGGYDNIDVMIHAPIEQNVDGRFGLYHQCNNPQNEMHASEFKKLSESRKYRTPDHFDYDDLRRKFWKNITYNPPLYGGDIHGSLYDNDVKECNMKELNTTLAISNKDNFKIKIVGASMPRLYFGMWKTTSPWHTENMDLYRINYLHCGAPKSWYVVPPEHGRQFEELAANLVSDSSRDNTICPAFLRHKTTIIAPDVLSKHSIPFTQITQEPGEFIVVFPFAYHLSFSHGFNCAEAKNFATERWVEYGKRASRCICRMDVFDLKFQPGCYELLKKGKSQRKRKRQSILKPPSGDAETKSSFPGIDGESQNIEQLKVPKANTKRSNPTAEQADLLMYEKSLNCISGCAKNAQNIKAKDSYDSHKIKLLWHSESDRNLEILKMDEETVITNMAAKSPHMEDIVDPVMLLHKKGEDLVIQNEDCNKQENLDMYEEAVITSVAAKSPHTEDIVDLVMLLAKKGEDLVIQNEDCNKEEIEWDVENLKMHEETPMTDLEMEQLSDLIRIDYSKTKVLGKFQ